MSATSIDTLSLPPTWYPVVEQIQAAPQPVSPVSQEVYLSPPGYVYGASSTITRLPDMQNSVEQLGWSAVEALETHLRFRSFAEDWNAPGMEAYDDM